MKLNEIFDLLTGSQNQISNDKIDTNKNDKQLKKFDQDIAIFQKLAVLTRYDEEDGYPFFSNMYKDENGELLEAYDTDKVKDNEFDNIYTLLNSIIVEELRLPYDKNIIVELVDDKYFNLDLSKTTLYNKANIAKIYYIFYGMNVFIPYADFPFSMGNILHVGENLPFVGIKSYWSGTEESFFGEYLDAAEIENNKPFSESFHLLAMYYLALNGYYNFKNAEDENFKIRNSG
ncbi:hypothetical protein [Fructilactobacillus sanfranciscensis]|uniref:hypothetical protein n=1 Tax=Fructilactobacillus sanfranciscensis TaxID=1625 RepID=UPI001118A008|nr:hypothetical protein [Fructilactobacillus sanfranciscensis]TNK96728.1 hypothetical protein DKP75_06935 [Fructilactobacillus sanfranciscensis]